MGYAVNRALVSGLVLALTGCISNETAPPDGTVGPLIAMGGVSSASCPDDVSFVLPERIDLSAHEIDWSQNEGDVGAYFAPLTPIALYKLESSDPRFGGLSGIDFLDNDTLVIVSDDGSLLWMDVAGERAAPADRAYIASLRGADGQPLDGKTYADSEGLAWNGENLFVSFERGHRVLGYDIEGCGSNARGALITDFWSGDFGEIGSVEENQGMEAIALRRSDELILGVEARQLNGAPYGLFQGNTGAMDMRLPAPELTMLVGMDFIGSETGEGRLYSLFRSYDPIRGNRIGIGLSEMSADGAPGEMERLIVIGSDVTVDNFEGIAVQAISETTDRIHLISDDNFSQRQQTLLMVLEFDHSGF